jgi:hypothetical protein
MLRAHAALCEVERRFPAHAASGRCVPLRVVSLTSLIRLQATVL